MHKFYVLFCLLTITCWCTELAVASDPNNEKNGYGVYIIEDPRLVPGISLPFGVLLSRTIRDDQIGWNGFGHLKNDFMYAALNDILIMEAVGAVATDTKKKISNTTEKKLEPDFLAIIENRNYKTFFWPPQSPDRVQISRIENSEDRSNYYSYKQIADNQIVKLRKKGYIDLSYFLIGDRINIVTPFEQYKFDGTQVPQKLRFGLQAFMPPMQATVMGRFNNIFNPIQTKFRVLIISIGEGEIYRYSGINNPPKTTTEWFAHSESTIPPELDKVMSTSETTIQYLIYEYKLYGGDNKIVRGGFNLEGECHLFHMGLKNSDDGKCSK